MSDNTKEIAFEKAIEWHLLNEGGYAKGDKDQFDPIKGIDPKVLIDFIKETQAEEWKDLYDLQKDKTEEILLDDLYFKMVYGSQLPLSYIYWPGLKFEVF